MHKKMLVTILLRVSIASVFLYAAVAATVQPYNWIGFLPLFATHFIPAQTLLLGFSVYQLALALWILSGWKTLYASLLASVTFLGIIAVNFTQTDILFRDFAIFFTSLALAVDSYQRDKK